MTMRNHVEWAASLDSAKFVDDPSGWQEDEIAALIRDAQEDGARAEREDRDRFMREYNLSATNAAHEKARADRAEKERDEARVSEKTALDDALKLLHERDRAIAERDEAREAWGRAESDACEWEEKAGVASADLATFTEKLHKAEQERDDLGCQLEALRAVQRDDMQVLLGRVAGLEAWRADVERDMNMTVEEKRRLLGWPTPDDEKGGA